jgi:hypothetical protein
MKGTNHFRNNSIIPRLTLKPINFDRGVDLLILLADAKNWCSYTSISPYAFMK